MGVKQCKACSEKKPLTEYYTANKGKTYQSICKSCFKSKQLVNAKKGKYWKKQNSKPYAISARKRYDTKHQGVYGIFDGETCLYVGESQQINKRWSDHRWNIKNQINNLYINLSKHPNMEFRILEETPNHKKIEKHWIEKLNPLYNS